MNNFEFYDLVLENQGLLLSIFIISIILHFYIFKAQIKSIFDPYFLAVISSIFCLTVVFLLYFSNNISFYLFLSYILTQVSFFLGFYAFKTPKNNILINKLHSARNKYNGLVAFYFFSLVYLLCQGIVYKIKGIPLFMESRLETFASGGGTGVLGRISEVTSIFSLYSFFIIAKIDKFRFSEIPKYIILLLIFLTFILSGSKSNFLLVFSIFWCFIIFNKAKGLDYHMYLNFIKKRLKTIIIFSLSILFFIIIIQNSNSANSNQNEINPLFSLILRLVHSGDVYWYSYPDNVYLLINGDRWFSALFTDTLGLFRIFDWEKLPEAIGITLKNIHHPSDILQGPNARHNIFGLIYFGYIGSIFFSYFLGVILSFIRNKLPYIIRADIFGGFFFTYLMCKCSAIDGDPMLTVTYINNLLFIFPPLFVCFLFVKEIFSYNKAYEK